MADFSLDSRSFVNFSLFFPLHKPPKPFSTFLPILPPHSSRRRKSQSLHLNVLSNPILPSPSASDFDIVSTTECSDGSVVFRFGDASEIATNFDLEEPDSKQGGSVSEFMEKCEPVQVLDGDHEREVTVKTIEREVRGENSIIVADSVNETDVCIEDVTIVEEESDSELELSEELLEVSQEEESPVVSVSDTKMNDPCGCVLALETDLHIEENSIHEDKDESSSQMGSLVLDNGDDHVEVVEDSNGSMLEYIYHTLSIPCSQSSSAENYAY